MFLWYDDNDLYWELMVITTKKKWSLFLRRNVLKIRSVGGVPGHRHRQNSARTQVHAQIRKLKFLFKISHCIEMEISAQ